ncbi:MAG: hypothetical protein B7Z58_16360 [Acidiphilium sp. 37-64-53]|uniref:PfkB family carbohydrate kinase n=1 Tax=Acidiphilium TaxID=522 RepID=UPI000BDD7959|nr:MULTISPECIES: PfkB family carbohydrate kinase [Acidiphilium]OYW00206.1 MAG: hypothetical protein B7Z58_16360 [Acidiphilium sp. 37-64-53]OZB28190.1 MAG: hypothetical protein B7X49_10250 [Acidiphilium sp. 34-64-41]HQT86242.1 PfkB family carbohydrate kinase [Acidiphilium rubrum]
MRFIVVVGVRVTLRYDIVTFGRIGVDLYAPTIGIRLADADGFVRAVGGCAGNVAIACARLGLRSAIVSAVGADRAGDYLEAALRREMVATTGLRRVAGCRSVLAFASVGPDGRPEIEFVRERAVDTLYDVAAVDTVMIGSTRALVISGAHVAMGIGDRALRGAIEAAREARALVVLDIDYRANIGPPAPSAILAARLRPWLAAADIVFGTEAEWGVAGNAAAVVDALRACRLVGVGLFVVKRGERGAVLIDGAVPDRLDDGVVGPGFAVATVNPLGAGDAFLAGFLERLLRGGSPEDALIAGNACGAIVASRLLCSTSCPTLTELETFLQQHQRGAGA